MNPLERLRIGLVYGAGDLAATSILGTPQLLRALGIGLVGAVLYAPEIRAYFAWIERRFAHQPQHCGRWQRAALGWLWFNPLWIARHTWLLRLLEGRIADLHTGVLLTGAFSFVCNAPLALTANYLIQNRLAPPHRVVGSAVFSAMMAVYYAWSEVWFG